VKQYEFQDEQFMSGAEKQLVLKAWITFLKHGCRSEHFTERLYDHISLHCSFIAHYNRIGFYDFYFASPDERTPRFLDQFDPKQPGLSAEMGATYWLGDNATAADLNHAMREATGPYVEKLRNECWEMKRQGDLALAALIAKKYGKQLSDCDMSVSPHAQRDSSANVCSHEAAPEQLSIFHTTG
jgi:hypothetical protein